MRRRVGGLAAGVLVSAIVLGACSNDSGVQTERADSADSVEVVEGSTPEGSTPETDPPESETTATDPPETDPTTTAPRPTLPPVTLPPVPTEPEDTTPDTTEPDELPADVGDGVGDPLFPDLGNPGIDVEHYDVGIVYDPENDTIEGDLTITLVPTEDRDEFTLDSAGPDVSSVTVDGEEAEFAQEEVELRITPATPLIAEKAVDVVILYSAAPDSGTSEAGLPNGWFHTDGGSYVLNEPDGARSWLPSNDHPEDKATWTFRITVPTGLTAVANGDPVETISGPDGDTWVWEESDPMPTYLIQLLTGDYEVIESVGPGDVPFVSVVLRDDLELMQPFLESLPEQLDFFDDFFGPYPLDRYGIAMSDSFGGLAMETQGRSLFSREDFLSGERGYIEELLLSHEMAHQWFGNAVSPGEWQDIWLNESFASYAQWMWLEEAGLSTLEGEADEALSTRVIIGGSPTAEPEAEELFGFNSYEGGAVILHALRLTIGDDAFFGLLSRWVADNVGESLHTEDFVELASEVAGTDLTDFFDEWLFAETVPDEFPEPVG